MSPVVQKFYALAMARYFDVLRVRSGRPLVLFFRDGGIGDVLCTFPAASALAQRHPKALRIYCTNPAFVSLPQIVSGAFHRVLGIKCNDLVAANVRRHTVYQFNYPDEGGLAGSSKYLGDEFAERHGLPDGLPFPPMELGKPSEKVAALLARDEKPPVCIHTGPTWAVREWPREKWEALVGRIRERSGHRVIQIGANRHFRDGERKDPVIAGADDCRDLYSLVETLQIVAHSRLLIGIDSGMIHAAAALNVPVIGIFGATRGAFRLPQRENSVVVSSGVPCLGCHHRHPRLHWQSGCPYDIRCMQEVSPEAVLAEALPVLRGSAVAMI